LLHASRRAVLVTLAADGHPRPVPIAFAFRDAPEGPRLYTALDEKPKLVKNPRDLARVRDIESRPRVAVLVDRWDEDWSRLAWIRLEGMATVLEPTDPSAHEHSLAVALLRERYPQYASQSLEQRPIIRVAVSHVRGWSA
jgi:PPOX class probable F420-dependent enzyme